MKTGTYADALCAIGHATLLQETTGLGVRIECADVAYRLSCADEHPTQQWGCPSPGFTYIWRSSKENRPQGASVFDLEAQKALADTRRQHRATTRARQNVAEALTEVDGSALDDLHPEYDFVMVIEQMFKRSGDPSARRPIGWQGDRQLFKWLSASPHSLLESVRQRLKGSPVPLGVKCTSSQLLNPSAGKGVFRTKTRVKKAASNFVLIDPFDEWMKLRGIWVSMLGYRSGKDFRFFVIDPADISVSHLTQLRCELRDLRLWGGTRVEVQATLELLRLLMVHSEFREEGGIALFEKLPRQVLRGLRMGFFKNLGSPRLMNDSLFPLPNWFEVRSSSDVDAYIEVCQEPYGARPRGFGPLSSLRTEAAAGRSARSDDIQLLHKYRTWLHSGELADLVEFHAGFGPRLLKALSAGEAAVPFRSRLLHTLLLKGYPTMKEIVESRGFQNVANAIRDCTIKAAWEKRKMGQSRREIRFGFAEDLKQHIKAGNEDFIAALSEFVQKQNWEVENKLDGRGSVVTTTDLGEVIALTTDPRFGAKLVGLLLLAYGFSWAGAGQPASPRSPAIQGADTVGSQPG
jgi:hypothetical protein